jgi:hypothetical protein
MAYDASNRYGLDDQSLWDPGDTHQLVARRALAAHGGVMSTEDKSALEGIAAGGAYTPKGAAGGGTDGSALGGTPYGTPGTGAAGGVEQQGKNAQTYSGTPGAAPTGPTTNQGTQDVLRNTLLQRATQGTAVDRNDPLIRQQADAFAAGQERARRNAVADQAEQFSAEGAAGSGAQHTLTRLTNENAARNVGSFEAELVGRELSNRRTEIMQALQGLQGQITADQTMALERELAQLNAQIQKLGIHESTSLGRSELALKDKLGMGGLNLDAMRLALQGKQFNDDLGFRIGDREQYYNDSALRYLL